MAAPAPSPTNAPKSSSIRRSRPSYRCESCRGRRVKCDQVPTLAPPPLPLRLQHPPPPPQKGPPPPHPPPIPPTPPPFPPQGPLPPRKTSGGKKGKRTRPPPPPPPPLLPCHPPCANLQNA